MKFKINKTKKPLNKEQIENAIRDTMYGPSDFNDEYMKAKNEMFQKYLLKDYEIKVNDPTIAARAAWEAQLRRH